MLLMEIIKELLKLLVFFVTTTGSFIVTTLFLL